MNEFLITMFEPTQVSECTIMLAFSFMAVMVASVVFYAALFQINKRQNVRHEQLMGLLNHVMDSYKKELDVRTRRYYQERASAPDNGPGKKYPRLTALVGGSRQ